MGNKKKSDSERGHHKKRLPGHDAEIKSKEGLGVKKKTTLFLQAWNRDKRPISFARLAGMNELAEKKQRKTVGLGRGRACMSGEKRGSVIRKSVSNHNEES